MAFDVFLKCRGIYDQAYSVKDLDEELEKPPVWTRSQLPAHLLRATLVQPLAIRLCQPRAAFTRAVRALTNAARARITVR